MLICTSLIRANTLIRPGINSIRTIEMSITHLIKAYIDQWSTTLLLGVKMMFRGIPLADHYRTETYVELRAGLFSALSSGKGRNMRWTYAAKICISLKTPTHPNMGIFYRFFAPSIYHPPHVQSFCQFFFNLHYAPTLEESALGAKS